MRVGTQPGGGAGSLRRMLSEVRRFFARLKRSLLKRLPRAPRQLLRITSEVRRLFARLKRSVLKRLRQQTPKDWRTDLAEASAALGNGDWAVAHTKWGAISRTYGDYQGAASAARLHRSVCERLLGWSDYERDLGRYDEPVGPGLRICVYTAIVNGYDSLKVPHHVNRCFRYVVFTDHDLPDTGVFEVRPLPYHEEDATRSARYIKTHPHHLLPDCDIAIWIDSNVMMVGRIENMIRDFLASGRPVAVVPHPLRTSLAEEVAACTDRNKDASDVMRRQLAAYQAEGFETSDLIESNFMMFDLRDAGCRSFLDTWWREISRFSRRDQLSVNYALDAAGVKPHVLTVRPASIRDHELFGFVAHDRGEGPASLLAARLGGRAEPAPAPRSYFDAREERLQPFASMPVDIVVCVHNALDDVRLCCESVEAKRLECHRLVLVDDGSNPETAAYLRTFAVTQPWVELVRNGSALGYTKSANIGLRRTAAPFAILLNSDTVVTDRWAEKLADAVFSTPGAGIVGPMSNAASHQSLPDHVGTKGQTAINELPPGHGPDEMNALCEKWADASGVPRVPLVHGFCFGITRETMERLGLFDEERFPRGYGEENDYCLRAADAGIGLVVATHTFVFHAKSKSYASETRTALMKAGSAAFRALHGEDRINRSVRAMQTNPEFERLRTLARRLYPA